MSGHAYHAALAESKRAQIVAAGQGLFLEQGFSRASMAELATRAGVSTTTLYRHFKSKDELFGAVLDGVRARFSQALDEVALPRDDLHGGLVGYAKTYATLLTDREIVGMARVIIAEAANFQPLAKSFHEGMKGEVFHRLDAYLRQAMKAKQLATHDTGDSMGLFLGYLERSFLLPRLLDPDHQTPRGAKPRILALAADMVLTMYRPKP